MEVQTQSEGKKLTTQIMVDIEQPKLKRGRGRPRKDTPPAPESSNEQGWTPKLGKALVELFCTFEVQANLFWGDRPQSICQLHQKVANPELPIDSVLILAKACPSLYMMFVNTDVVVGEEDAKHRIMIFPQNHVLGSLEHKRPDVEKRAEHFHSEIARVFSTIEDEDAFKNDCHIRQAYYFVDKGCSTGSVLYNLISSVRDSVSSAGSIFSTEISDAFNGYQNSRVVLSTKNDIFKYMGLKTKHTHTPHPQRDHRLYDSFALNRDFVRYYPTGYVKTQRQAIYKQRHKEKMAAKRRHDKLKEVLKKQAFFGSVYVPK